MNINEVIFRHYGAERKKQIIKDATHQQLLAVVPATVERIIKEVGTGRYRSRDKDLNISGDNQKGNRWNSTVERVSIYKKKLYIDLYVQYSNTDTTISENYSTFFASGDYRGSIEFTDRYDGKQTEYISYTQNQKAEVMRSILLEYIFRKYYRE